MTRKIRYKEPASNFTRIAAPTIDPVNRASIGMDKFMGEYYFLQVDKIIPYKNQARAVFNDEDLQGLADTIKEHGVRSPLTVVRSQKFDGMYEVVSGERRLRASKIVGLEKVPCIILDASSNAEEIALIENVQRIDLHPIELARGLKIVVDNYGRGGQAEIERRLGLNKTHISKSLRLLQLSKEIQDLAIEKNFSSRDSLLGLLKLASDDKRRKKILGESSDKNNSSFSVLRVRIDQGDIKIQKNSISSLSSHQRNCLKEALLSIADEL